MYQRKIRLHHNEVPAKINQDTGEIKQLSPVSKKNEFFEYIDVNSPFDKTYKRGWEYLLDVLTPRQIKITMMMSHMAKRFTNSLAPLNDDTTLRHLEDMFGVNKSIVKKDLRALFEYGVYAKWEVEQKDSPHTKFWIFNPYLSMNGTGVHKHSKSLFSNTTIGVLVRNSK